MGSVDFIVALLLSHVSALYHNNVSILKFFSFDFSTVHQLSFHSMWLVYLLPSFVVAIGHIRFCFLIDESKFHICVPVPKLNGILLIVKDM